MRAKVEKVAKNLDPRIIQKGFMRAYPRSETVTSDFDEGLIPKANKEWYLDEKSNIIDFEPYVESDEVHTDSESEDTSWISLPFIDSETNYRMV